MTSLPRKGLNDLVLEGNFMRPLVSLTTPPCIRLHAAVPTEVQQNMDLRLDGRNARRGLVTGVARDQVIPSGGGDLRATSAAGKEAEPERCRGWLLARPEGSSTGRLTDLPGCLGGLLPAGLQIDWRNLFFCLEGSLQPGHRDIGINRGIGGGHPVPPFSLDPARLKTLRNLVIGRAPPEQGFSLVGLEDAGPGSSRRLCLPLRSTDEVRRPSSVGGGYHLNQPIRKLMMCLIPSQQSFPV